MPEVVAAVDVAGAVAVAEAAVEPGSLAGLHCSTFELHFASLKQLGLLASLLPAQLPVLQLGAWLGWDFRWP